MEVDVLQNMCYYILHKNSQEDNCSRVLVLIMLQACRTGTSSKKRHWQKHFTEHLRTTASNFAMGR